jgi:hypothetical protein
MVAVVAPVAVAVPIVGAPGTVDGVTEALAVEFGPVPAGLVAFTVNVTAVPLANPVTVIPDAIPVALCPVDAVTV